MMTHDELEKFLDDKGYELHFQERPRQHYWTKENAMITICDDVVRFQIRQPDKTYDRIGVLIDNLVAGRLLNTLFVKTQIPIP